MVKSEDMPAALEVRGLTKVYTHGLLKRRETFRLSADFVLDAGQVVGVMGPNGSGKTTLFELITGSNAPNSGRVLCRGRDIHQVRYDQRDRLAIHYHQSYQVRRFRRRKPAFLMQAAGGSYPLIHLFDEPQFNTQDGYIGFMLDFFRKLRREGRLVFICLHPYESFHIEILREICEHYFFIDKGSMSEAPDWPTLVSRPAVRRYLGHLADV